MKASFYRYMIAAFAAASMAATGLAFAQADAAKSTISAISKQMNVPVEGKFKKFDAKVSFDPAKPAAASAHPTMILLRDFQTEFSMAHLSGEWVVAHARHGDFELL